MSLLSEELHSLSILLTSGVRASVAFDKSIHTMRMEEAETRIRMVQATTAAKRQLRTATQQPDKGGETPKRKDMNHGGQMD